MYRGVLTGFNRAFVIDGAKRAELIASDPRSAEIIKPLAVGDDIRRWHIHDRDRWLIVTRIGTDMERYPAIMAHLRQWQPQLEARWDKGDHWWELRACAYYDVFAEPKIVFPDIAKEPRFVLDRLGYYATNTTYVLAVDDPYLAAVLNTAPLWAYSSQRLTVMGDAEKGGRMRFFAQFVERIPIVEPPQAERSAICALAERCIDAGGVGCQEWEREIDERVAALYGL
jgi:hypothetical protein